MRVLILIIISLVTSLSIACSPKSKAESTEVEIKEVTLIHETDDVPLPPADLTSNFNSLQDWLNSICKNEKPQKTIAKYNFGLFESPGECVIFLFGTNDYDNGDSSHTRIGFEPADMYFQLPKGEYANLNRDQLLNKLTVQLKTFTGTEIFKTSFFAKSNTIVFQPNGKTIWSK